MIVEWIGRILKVLSLVALGCMAVGMAMFAQTATAKPLVFDVISIHPANPDSRFSRVLTSPDRFSASGVSMVSLIMSAYPLKSPDQISGVSGAMGSARFDVEAKMDEDTAAALKKLPKEEATAQRRLMMQALLADRFKLRVHQESKEAPIYALVIAKGGFRLKDADPKNTYVNGIKGPDGRSHAGMMMMSNGRLTGQAISMSNLAANLGGMVHRIVEDKTGLTGKYDVALQWSPEDNGATLPPGGQQDAPPAADSGPSIFTALQEQLGLKLESAREPVDAIVVDHVEMPSEN